MSAGELRKRRAVHGSIEAFYGSDTSEKGQRPMSWSVLSQVSKSKKKERKAQERQNEGTQAHPLKTKAPSKSTEGSLNLVGGKGTQGSMQP